MPLNYTRFFKPIVDIRHALATCDHRMLNKHRLNSTMYLGVGGGGLGGGGGGGLGGGGDSGGGGLTGGGVQADMAPVIVRFPAGSAGFRLVIEVRR
jgi:hypothetical protein